MTYHIRPLVDMCAFCDRQATHTIESDTGRQVGPPMCALHAKRMLVALDTDPARERVIAESTQVRAR